MNDEQHDDHIWLTVGGQGWAICEMHGPYILLWRGYAPDFEYSLLDMTHFDPELYYKEWLAMMEREYDYGLVLPWNQVL